MKWNWYYLIDVFLILMVLLMLVWAAVIVAGNDTNKPQWLLIPVTAIYVIVSLYMAAGSLSAARASREAVDVMRETLEEMKLSRRVQYSPYISFPGGLVCTVFSDDTAILYLRNLLNVPMAQFAVFLWEMEDSPSGKALKFSSMRVSEPADYAADETDITVEMLSSQLPDEEKREFGTNVLQEYLARSGGVNPNNSLCFIRYYIRGEINPLIHVYDLLLERPEE
jgi:hypothetical protein